MFMDTPPTVIDIEDNTSTAVLSSFSEPTASTSPISLDVPNKYLSVTPSFIRTNLEQDVATNKLLLRHVPPSLGLEAIEDGISAVLSKYGIDEPAIDHLRYSTCAINEGNLNRPASDSIVVKFKTENVAKIVKEELKKKLFTDSRGDSFSILISTAPYCRDPFYAPGVLDMNRDQKKANLFETPLYKQFEEKLSKQDVWETLSFRERPVSIPAVPEDGDEADKASTIVMTALVSSLLNKPMRKRDKNKKRRNDDKQRDKAIMKVSKIQPRQLSINTRPAILPKEKRGKLSANVTKLNTSKAPGDLGTGEEGLPSPNKKLAGKGKGRRSRRGKLVREP